MYADFISALNEKYSCAGIDDLSGLDLQHYTFASTTNQRGQDAIGVFEAYGFSMPGLKILDVGCAYGGFSIEAARKGASCYGVEIMPHLFKFAQLNSKGEVYDGGACQFVLADATSPEFLKKVPHDYFDLIIVNDVFEHVYDTVQLLKNLSKVGNDQCVLYFVIPNGNDLRFVAREGHTGYCGLSLLPPLLWHTRLTASQSHNSSIYYRQYEYYLALFRQFGFGEIDLINYPGYIGRTEAKEKLVNDYEVVRQAIATSSKDFPDMYAQKFLPALEMFDQQLQYDLQSLNGPELAWKYSTNFWAGFAGHKVLHLEPLKQLTNRSFRSDEKGGKTQFKLSIIGDRLFIEASCNPSNQNIEFAFDLMRRGERIDRSQYQQKPRYEWRLRSPGMYWVAIYVKKREHDCKGCRILTQPLYFSHR